MVEVQEACLVLLRVCAKQTDNVRSMLDSGILDLLYSFIQSVELTPLSRPSLLLLEAVSSKR